MKSRLLRAGLILALLLLVGLAAWWGYSTYLAPSKAVAIRNRATRDATQQVMEHQYDAALATINASLAKIPGDWELLVWQSALLGKLGRSGQESLVLAEKQASQVDVLIELGTVSTMVEWPEKTQEVGERLIEQAPELPHGYFFLAQARELTGHTVEALRSSRLIAARERIGVLSTFQR
jgi:predicted Zn-dependent protease